ncbi:NAD-dependent epimerase/dehydratase family protein [Allostreptomyces psammosilenae]|uniref:UDP-glucose 4-epimerase n=1 Tax=Allostreptomyces psammosilenae TaxID=1892865 RepID=A0A852ZV07_9ACTN|nr:NAD-dependent epimerase/dehydratase family protein [Allostreptomyces psammosilenae]NYI05755.1 UDP-glucose 4-epimerase [Allostreptomyces psammosilenae]
MGEVVLVTGVARDLGGRFARRIRREPGVDHVVGVDEIPPRRPLGDGATFVRTDLRTPAVARVIAEYGVHTVVHMNVVATPLGAPGNRSALKESNVIGTMQLLGACQRAGSVRRLVVKSSTSVYGSAPRDPAVFTETTPVRALPGGGYAKDAADVETYVRGFARRRPDVAVTVLRFANILGPSADSPMAEYFCLPVLPTVFGFDPRLQFVHTDDAVEVLRLAALEPRRGTLNTGTFNVAGDGVLLLSQAARRLGRPTLPLPVRAVGLTGHLLRGARLAGFSPEHVRMLTHGRVVDTAQLRDVFGHRLARTTEEAFADFARGRAGVLPVTAAADRLLGGAQRWLLDRAPGEDGPPGERPARERPARDVGGDDA